MKALIDHCLEEHVILHSAPNTAIEVTRLIETQMRPILGRQQAIAVSRSEVMALHGRIRDTPRQANLVLSILSKMFNLAEAWELRPEGAHPCRHTRRYPENSRERF